MEIKALVIDILKDWFEFFEQSAFVDNDEWRGCYCTACFYPKHPDYPVLSKRRKDYARWLVESGRMKG